MHFWHGQKLTPLTILKEHQSDINLDEILRDKKVDLKCFYVIELMVSGSKISFYNYVLTQAADSGFNVLIFTYKNGKWIKKENCHLECTGLTNSLFHNQVVYPKGINYEDIMISKFAALHVKASEFYLSMTYKKDD